VKAYGKKCEICQQRSKPRRLYGKLEPITLPAPGEMVTIDFAGPFTETDDKNTHILVIVDNGSKEAFLQATKGVTAEIAARGLVDKYVTQKGAPRVIASDRGSAFISAAMKSISDALGMKQQFSVAYASRRWSAHCRHLLVAISGIGISTCYAWRQRFASARTRLLGSHRSHCSTAARLSCPSIG
jgi:hypothetical protein